MRKPAPPFLGGIPLFYRGSPRQSFVFLFGNSQKLFAGRVFLSLFYGFLPWTLFSFFLPLFHNNWSGGPHTIKDKQLKNRSLFSLRGGRFILFPLQKNMLFFFFSRKPFSLEVFPPSFSLGGAMCLFDWETPPLPLGLVGVAALTQLLGKVLLPLCLFAGIVSFFFFLVRQWFSTSKTNLSSETAHFFFPRGLLASRPLFPPPPFGKSQSFLHCSKFCPRVPFFFRAGLPRFLKHTLSLSRGTDTQTEWGCDGLSFFNHPYTL